MPTPIYIAILAACTSIVVLATVLVVAVFFLKTRVIAMEANAADLKEKLAELLGESRTLVREAQVVVTRIPKPLEDIEHMTRTAKAWTERADRIVNAVGTVAEPPLFFMSKNIKTFGGIASGVLQMLLAPKR